MKVEVKGVYSVISIEVEGSLVLANREMVKAIIESLKDTIVELDRELAKNIKEENIT